MTAPIAADPGVGLPNRIIFDKTTWSRRGHILMRWRSRMILNASSQSSGGRAGGSPALLAWSSFSRRKDERMWRSVVGLVVAIYFALLRPT